MKGAPCPVCRGAVRVEIVYDSGLGYSFLSEFCNQCGVGSRRRMTTFEQVHLLRPKGFYSSVLSAADLRALAPVPGVCVMCGHPWTLHSSPVDSLRAGCAGKKRVQITMDDWEYRRCWCTERSE